MERISVFCGSSEGNDPQIVAGAQALGRALADRGTTLVYGGTPVRLMGHLADAALGRQGRVIGVIPEFLLPKEIVHPQVEEMILVGTMHQRKMKMHELSQGTIALPGGFGTLEEFFEMLTWGQLGLHTKPMGLLNLGGFFDGLLGFMDTMVTKGFLGPGHRNMVLVDDSCTGLLDQMQGYVPDPTPKWIKKEHT